MWWKGVRIAAVVSAVVVTLAFLALLVAVTRPAILWGVTGESLAASIGEGVCHMSADGEWVCEPGTGKVYRVDVDWMGCWQAERPAPRQSGCIELGDIITLD